MNRGMVPSGGWKYHYPNNIRTDEEWCQMCGRWVVGTQEAYCKICHRDDHLICRECTKQYCHPVAGWLTVCVRQ